MPKHSTYPYLFDEEKSISISDLKKLKYFNKNCFTSGTVNWTCRGQNTGRINVSVSISDYISKVVFDYTCNGNSYKYKVDLIPFSSNLCNGVVWYFICPFTFKRCRKLHLIDERFMHRSALPSGMYSKQTESKKWRLMDKLYGAYFRTDDLYSQLYQKNFKKTYAGKPTKKYLRILEQIQKAESIPYDEIERLILT